MISLDIDLSYLTRYYHIGMDALEKYRNKSIREIMVQEAEQGNKFAADFLIKITSDPKELAKVFQLINPKNRYLILINMNKEDLTKIMALLKPQELILGLSIFTKEGILELMKEMDAEALSVVILKNMDINKFLKVLPEEFLDEFFKSEKLNKNILMKGMEEVDETELQKMMEKINGQPCYEDKDSILQKMNKMDDKHFADAILSMEKRGKEQLIGNVLKEKPDLFEEFSPEAMIQPFMTMEKEDILKCLTVLNTEELMTMTDELPQELMALIATQIDPQVFAQVLTSEFKDVIADCGINI